MNLREAAEAALKAMSSFESGTNGLYEGEFAEEIAVLRAALAEPVLERNFCPRCGKRSFPDTIHTCTPPHGIGEQQ